MKKLRECQHCGARFEFEQFNRGRPPAYCSDECRKSRATARYAANRDTVLARSKAWREANPERYSQLQKRWRQANPGYLRAWHEARPTWRTTWYSATIDARRAYGRLRYRTKIMPKRLPRRTGPFLSHHPRQKAIQSKIYRRRLGTGYLRRQFVRRTTLRHADVPLTLVEVLRLRTAIYRQIQERTS